MIKKYASDEEFKAAYDTGFAAAMEKNAQFFKALGRAASPLVSRGARSASRILRNTNWRRDAVSLARQLEKLNKNRNVLSNQLTIHELANSLGLNGVAKTVHFKPGSDLNKWLVRAFYKNPQGRSLSTKFIEREIPLSLREFLQKSTRLQKPALKNVKVRLPNDPKYLKKQLDAINSDRIYDKIGKWTAGIGGGGLGLTSLGALALGGRSNLDDPQQFVDGSIARPYGPSLFNFYRPKGGYYAGYYSM